MEARLAIKYTGPAVDSGQMDVYEASTNMIAFSEFVVLAAKSAFGDSISAKAEVAGFSRGSFVTDLVFNLSGVTAGLFASASPENVFELIKQAFDLWKHLKGEPPKEVRRDGNFAHVTNNSGQIIQVNVQSLNMVFSDKGAESAERFVRKALEKPGMDSVEIQGGSSTLSRVSQAESASFVPVSPSETITDSTVKMGLILEAPMFKDDLKWRFSDGGQSFHADVEDRDFLARVDAGERFGKGDVLIADVRIVQEQSIGNKLTARRSIVKVHEHKAAPTQGALR